VVTRVEYWVAISEDEATFANDNDPNQTIRHKDEIGKTLSRGELLETTITCHMAMRFRTEKDCQTYCDSTRIKFKPVHCSFPESIDTVRKNR